MAHAGRLPCFICYSAMPPAQMRRIDRPEDQGKREIAIVRRDNANREPLEVTDATRICCNCNISILHEIEVMQLDPLCLRLNVLAQTSSHTCLICNNNNNLTRLSIQCRTQIYLKKNIYVNYNVKCCPGHLDDSGYLFDELLDLLRFVNRPYTLKGNELKSILEELRNVANNASRSKYDNENNFTDEEFSSLSPINKEQFRDLFNYCDPVVQTNGLLYVTKRHLLTFLCKIRQNLSDEFLTFMFDYKTRQSTSMVIATVRKSLMLRFAPENVGINSINRQDFIERHVTAFANQLYNPEPEQQKAIIFCDGSYLEVQKPTNFQAQRMSYSSQKHYNLVKPGLMVAPDGYILDIHGPYFSDNRNNDAAMLQNELEDDDRGYTNWFQNGDIFILDRGYRDSEPVLQQLGIQMKMPPFLERNQKQFTTEEANSSRLITKSRWIVESRNGHLKSIFKFFAGSISVVHCVNLKDFLQIAAAIINKYKETINMQNADVDLANELLERATRVNIMQARVEAENLKARNANWLKLNHNHIPGFPVLTLDYLRDLTVGVYQVKLAPAYIQDKLLRDNAQELQFDTLITEPGLLRARVYSRFSGSKSHQIFVAFVDHLADAANNEDEYAHDEEGLILAYYCTCKAGARTLGSCAHVASILWYLGYARHVNIVKYPSKKVLRRIEDSAHRN